MCGFLELLRGAEQVMPCGGALGARLGACIGLFVGLYWAGTMVWLAVIGVLQIRERFDVELWSSSSPEAGRRRERESLFPKDMLNPAGTGRNDRTGLGLRARGAERPALHGSTRRETTSRPVSCSCHQSYPFQPTLHNLGSPDGTPQISPRPTSTIRKIPGGGEARQFGGTPTDASCSG